MAEISIGTAKITLSMESGGMEAVLDRVKQKQQGLGEIAKQEADKMTASQRRVVSSLERSAQRVGLTREEWLRYRIVTETTGKTQESLLKLLDANTGAITRQGNALQKTVNQVNQYGLTQKQQVAAMRQVPAQMTDIFVSLQGGQNPMTVLIQQGGQLKDVFGGVVPAARALAAQVMGLVNPLTLVAGAGSLVAYSFINASSEQTAFAKAIAQSGNNADLTTAKLQNMAAALSAMQGVSVSSASDTVAKVAATGRFTAEQIYTVAEAAEKMRVSTGQSVDDTIAAFVRIGKDPVAAILQLNESQNFLTHATYQQVKALQEQGDMAGAAEVALDAYANRVRNVTKTVEENIGYLQQFARAAKELWADISDAVLGIGRATTNADLVRQQQDNIEGLIKARDRMRAGSILQGGVYGGMTEEGYAAAIARSREEIRRLTQFDNVTSSGSKDSAVNSVAQQQLDALLAGNRSREERQALEEQQIRNLYAQAGATKQVMTLEQALEASRARYKESLPKGRDGSGEARSLANAQGKSDLQSIRDHESVVRNEIANTTKVLQAEYSARVISESNYFQQRRELSDRDFRAQEQSLLQQIDHLRSRSQTGKDAINTATELGKAEATLAKVRADHATQQVILGIQEADLTNKRRLAIEGYRESLDASNEASQMSVDAALLRITMGQREADLQIALAKVMADGAKERRRIEKEFAADKDEELYQQKLQALQDFMDEQVAIVKGGYDQMRAAEGDWINGMRTGMADWLAKSQDVASQVNAITTNSLDSATNALTSFATTGKATWREMLVDIGEQITKFMMQQAVMKFLQYIIGMWGGGGYSQSSLPIGSTDMGSTGGPYYAAKGDAFPGAAGLSKYSGTVVNKPTPFYFAKGAGVMGEAGMEGIFPLQRGADGKLGVKAIGAGAGSAPITIVTNVTVNSDGSSTSDTQTAGDQAGMYRELAGSMSNVAKQEIQRATMPGGILWKRGV